MDTLLDQLPGITRELINYGPYALLAIFVLIIAPKHTKRFIECQDTDKTKRRLLCGIASANWVVVFVMCTYIYINWSPITAYQGSLGRHGQDADFISIDSNSYISSKPVNGQLEFEFAYISETGAIKKDDRFNFIYVYNKKSTDYSIPVSLLKGGKLHISSNSNAPSQLMIDEDYDPQTPSTLLPPVAYFQPPEHTGGFMAAYAAPAPDNAIIIKQLSSPNPRFQAVGRRKLQAKSIPELQLMLSTPNISAQAKQQIQTIISSR